MPLVPHIYLLIQFNRYWPDEKKPVDLRYDKDLTIKCLKQTNIGDTVVRRDLVITKAGYEPHYVTQIHYIGWPDHGVPTKTKEDFQTVLYQLIDFLVNKPDEEKVLIHCSAGIGRTGTSITLALIIASIEDQLAKNGNDLSMVRFSIFKTVRQIREYRAFLVQMEEQYLFIYVFLHEWIIEKQKKIS